MSEHGIDMQFVLNIGAGLVSCLCGWLGKTLWDAVQSLKEDLHRIELELPTNYVRKDEFTESMKEIKEMLGKIFDRLDGKADKP